MQESRTLRLPHFLRPHSVAARRHAEITFIGGSQVVIDGEIGMRRAGGILQAERHVHRAVDARGKVLHVKVAEHVQEFLPGQADGIGRLEHLMDGPPHDAGVVPIVPEEGNGRGNSLDARIQRRRDEGEGAALALTPGHHAGGIGLLQRSGEIHGLLYVAESAAVVERLPGRDATVYPALLALLEDALVADAHKIFDAPGVRRRIHIIDIGPIPHVVDAHGIFAGSVGDAHHAARDGAAIGGITHMIGGAHFVRVLRNFREDGLQWNAGKLLKGRGPERIEIGRSIGGAHHVVGTYADIPTHGVPQAYLVKTGLQLSQCNFQGAVGRDGDIGPQDHLRDVGHEGNILHQLEAGGPGSGIHMGRKRVGTFFKEKPAQFGGRRAAGRVHRPGATCQHRHAGYC